MSKRPEQSAFIRFPREFWKWRTYQLRYAKAEESILQKGSYRTWHQFWAIDMGSSHGITKIGKTIHRRTRRSVGIHAPGTLYEDNFEMGKLASSAWLLLEEKGRGRSALRQITGASGFAFLEDPGEQIRQMINKIVDISASSLPGRSFLVASLVENIIGTLFNLHAEKSVGTSTRHRGKGMHSWRRIALQELEKAFPAKLTLSDFARALNTSRSNVTHNYGKLCGESFGDTVKTLRMEKAVAFLRNGKLSIKQISANLGFSHQSQFTAFLKQETGLSPSEIRDMKSVYQW